MYPVFSLNWIIVLRMLSNYVGENLFLKGVSLYLKKNLYANSVTNDLWEGIGTATGLTYRHTSSSQHSLTTGLPLLGIDIVHLMHNWIAKVNAMIRVLCED